MSDFNERLRQQYRALADGDQHAAADADREADGLMVRALDVHAEPATTLDTGPLESQYSVALAAHIEAKHEQVERIENRLENLIEQQASRLRRIQGQQPGLLAMPGTRVKWQQQLAQQQSTMQRLNGRLEAVRDIRDDVGLHGPRIEDLAVRKLRIDEPGIASEWHEMMQARRLHEALLRRRQKDKDLAHANELQEQSGRSLRQALSQSR